jgi:F-type H+-transporting ATPase subunit delta
MNAGVVASRYAKALLKFVQETGNGDKVYAQAGILALRMQEIRQLKDYVENHPEIDPEKRMQLLETALGEPMAMELRRFVGLVISRRRTEFFHRMLYSFLSQYREFYNIKVGSTAVNNVKKRSVFFTRIGIDNVTADNINDKVIIFF